MEDAHPVWRLDAEGEAGSHAGETQLESQAAQLSHSTHCFSLSVIGVPCSLQLILKLLGI
jgi:hypothetical protein